MPILLPIPFQRHMHTAKPSNQTVANTTGPSHEDTHFFGIYSCYAILDEYSLDPPPTAAVAVSFTAPCSPIIRNLIVESFGNPSSVVNACRTSGSVTLITSQCRCACRTSAGIGLGRVPTHLEGFSNLTDTLLPGLSRQHGCATAGQWQRWSGGMEVNQGYGSWPLSNTI
ncbi:hypothetical protein BCR44DRAFT_289173 [Catenaria anguillulae PL171]|uniref:Uncharacterized protein n=1 Tax=Catenaria anguillulae PL171 TaxID=765915 RepID=A0A1Y2HC80_9FUNG|nr:hypothetical protein BCR44DRAFT_289173 [Catenaria anguillulae PL171]